MVIIVEPCAALTTHRRSGTDLLHRELVLADAVEQRAEDDVVDERLEVDVEGAQHVRAGAHRQDLLDHLLRLLAGHRSPVVLDQQVQHLVAVAQLLGHHAQDHRLLLLVLGAREGELVLLDRAELGRGLGADLREQLVRDLRLHVAGLRVLGLALLLPALDRAGHAALAEGAQPELRIAREVAVPVLDQVGVVGQVGVAPALHRLVVLARQLGRGRVRHVGGILRRSA